MLNLWRRHTNSCSHTSRDSLKCKCPIWIDWRVSHQRVRKPIGTRDWAIAQQRAREMEAEGITQVSGPISVKKATEDFVADATTNLKPTTLKQYKLLARQLNTFCEDRGFVFLRQLGVVEVREFRNSWTIAPRTAGKHLERLKRFFNWCIENEWLEVSPAKPLKSPKVSDTDSVPFTEEQVTAILKACYEYEGPNCIRLIVLTNFMLASGLRIGDAVTLAKERIVKTSDGYSVVLRTAKTGTQVFCPLPDDVAQSVLALDSEYPFWTRKSSMEKCASNWRKIFSRVFKASGVSGHPHQLRHTFAKRLLAAGVPVGYVATLLGHSKVAVTERHYSRWIAERQAVVDAAVRATWKRARTGHTVNQTRRKTA
jgi:integrase/recombinase XerD